MAETKIKGIAVFHLREFVEKQHGESGLARLRDAASPEARQTFEAASAAAWYPLRHMVELEQRAVELFYGGDVSKAQMFGEYDLNVSVGRVYKLFFPLLEPTWLLKRSAKLWTSYLDTGGLRIEETGPKHVRVTVEGIDAAHPVYCHDLCGSFRGAFAACGAAATIQEVACRHRGAPACVFDAAW